jgi:hypothetical protein
MRGEEVKKEDEAEFFGRWRRRLLLLLLLFLAVASVGVEARVEGKAEK